MPSVRKIMYAACSVALFFVACGKEKNEDPVSGLYVSANIVMYDSVKLYTKSGIITDTTIIHGAIERRLPYLFFKFNLKAGKDSVKKDRTVNIDPEGGDNYFDFKTYKRAYDILSNNNGLILLLTKAPLVDTIHGGQYPIGNALYINADSLIRKYPNSYVYRYEGMDIYTRTAKKYAVLEESAGYLTYPAINFFFSRGYMRSFSSGIEINNQFNEAVPAMLENEDTLIVQISRLRLVKR